MGQVEQGIWYRLGNYHQVQALHFPLSADLGRRRFVQAAKEDLCLDGVAVNRPYESYKSGDYLANNPTWDEEDSAWKAGQVLKMLDRNHLAPKSIVDVGCGAGGILASLHNA